MMWLITHAGQLKDWLLFYLRHYWDVFKYPWYIARIIYGISIFVVALVIVHFDRLITP